MSLNFKKCFLFLDAADYLDYLMKPRQMHIATKAIGAVYSFWYPSPTSVLISFLGICDVYHRFLASFSHIAATLNNRLRQGKLTQFELNNEKRQTTHELETKLASSVSLGCRKMTDSYVVQFYACENGMACVVLQKQKSGEIWLAGYWCKTDNDDLKILKHCIKSAYQSCGPFCYSLSYFKKVFLSPTPITRLRSKWKKIDKDG